MKKNAYFVLFALGIRDAFYPTNKFICVKKGVIVDYHHRIKHQICIFTHAYIMHITVFIGIEVAFSRRKVGVFLCIRFLIYLDVKRYNIGINIG